MTAGLLLTSFLLGLRHGVDWDHVAAIADLNSTGGERGRGFRLSLYYALGHAVVVLALGTLLIIAGAAIPESLDRWMGRVVGATLVWLGATVLWDLARHRGAVRLRSRWMLILQGTFAGIRRVRRLRDRRRIVLEHSHAHDHDDDLDHTAPPAHDHAHDRARDGARDTVGDPALDRPLAPIARGGRRTPAGSGRPRPRRHRHAHRHHIDLPADRPVGGGVATGIGMLHGIGIESPTQIAIFVASTSVAGQAVGLALLGSWVAGLVLANAGLALVAGAGLLRPDANTWTVRAVAVVVAALSIGLGLRYLLW